MTGNGHAPTGDRFGVGGGRRRAGSALIAVYWVIALLSLAVFTGGQFLLIGLETRGNRSLRFRAEQLADAGIALAANDAVRRWDPLLRRQVSDTESFAARIVGEGSRFNPNVLARSERGREVLAELFFSWGLSEHDSRETAALLADWVDPDHDELPLGAERIAYRRKGLRGLPFNRPFRKIEEMKYVGGFDRVMAARPQWRRAFTLWSRGGLDLNEAPAESIAVACRCAVASAQQLVAVRNGGDGVPRTKDDVQLQSLAEAFDVLGLGEAAREEASNVVTVDSSVMRLVSVGRIGEMAVERTVVVRNRGANPEILEMTTRRIR